VKEKGRKMKQIPMQNAHILEGYFQFPLAVTFVAGIFFVNITQLVASDMALATSFFITLQSASRAYSAAPRRIYPLQ